MYSGNRGFDLMMPKPQEETTKEDFNYNLCFSIFSKKITLTLKVNDKE